mmetsp:Transcript_23970/g.67014  ORF Transcript_23970/g.67014 Transcript_23970/m.67014 type:complete len:309 (+) Transcript_23970:288-1214(+)
MPRDGFLQLLASKQHGLATLLARLDLKCPLVIDCGIEEDDLAFIHGTFLVDIIQSTFVHVQHGRVQSNCDIEGRRLVRRDFEVDHLNILRRLERPHLAEGFTSKQPSRGVGGIAIILQRDQRQIRRRHSPVPRIVHLLRARHVDPNLKALHEGPLLIGTTFGMHDAAAARHPLHAGCGVGLAVAQTVAVPAGARLEVRGDVESAVRMPVDGEVVGVRDGALLLLHAEVIAHEEGVGVFLGDAGREGLQHAAVIAEGVRDALTRDFADAHQHRCRCCFADVVGFHGSSGMGWDGQSLDVFVLLLFRSLC